VDCTLRAPSGLVLPGELVATLGDERILRLPPEQLDDLLDKLRTGGGHVIQVQPNRRTLEDLLLTELGRNNPIAGEEASP
jgi:hypothetical protein